MAVTFRVIIKGGKLLDYLRIYELLDESLTFGHRSFKFNSNKSPTRCKQIFNLLSWRLFTAQHVSGVFPPIIRSSMTAVAASGFTFVSWWQSCCVCGRAGWPDHEHSTAVIELLMMGGKTPKTCWAVNKRQDNKLKNCFIRLVIYLN